MEAEFIQFSTLCCTHVPVFPVCVLVAQSCLTLCDPWTVAFQASLPTEFSRQVLEWVAILFSGDPGIEPGSPALLADSLQSFWGRLSSWGVVHEL